MSSAQTTADASVDDSSVEPAWRFNLKDVLHLFFAFAFIFAAAKMVNAYAGLSIGFFYLFCLAFRIPGRNLSAYGVAMLGFVALLSAWLSVLPLVGIFLFPILLGYLLAVRRYAILAFILVVSPPGLAFMAGCRAYVNGEVMLTTLTCPVRGFQNPHPVYRCSCRRAISCISMGNEEMTQDPYDYAVFFLTETFGVMPGAYDGTYPTHEEAVAALATGVSTPSDRLLNDEIIIGSTIYRLDSGVGEALLKDERLRHLDVQYWGRSPVMPNTIIAAIYDRDCLIMRFPLRQSPPTAIIALIGREKGRPFAYYAEGDDRLPAADNRFHGYQPPVRWERDVPRENYPK